MGHAVRDWGSGAENEELVGWSKETGCESAGREYGTF